MNTYDFPKRKQETSEPRRNYDIIYAPLFYEWQRILTKHTFVFAAVEFLKQYWFSIKNIWRLYLYFSLKNSIFLPIISHRLLRLPLAFHLLSTSMNLFGLFAITTFFRPFLDCWRWRLGFLIFLCGAVELFYESRHLHEAHSAFEFAVKGFSDFFYFKHQLAKILTLRISLVVILCGMSLVRENTC